MQPGLPREQWLWGLLRLGVGWLCLWSFLDKTFGLGYPTLPGWAWINGGSPTYPFLRFGAKGILGPLATHFLLNPVVDWLFMLVQLFVGVALLAGVAVRLGGWLGAGLFAAMYLIGFSPPPANPFLSEHVVYLLLCLAFALTSAGRSPGLGRAWARIPLVQRHPWLQ
jgi:thiosulfate dehydrogenase [quinone] large subunit